MKEIKHAKFYVRRDRLSEKIAVNAAEFLQGRGIKVYKSHTLKDRNRFDELSVDSKKKAQIAFSFGGDGTLLGAISSMGRNQIPILGISCGTQGFLTQSSMDQLEHDLRHIVSDRIKIQERNRFVAYIGKQEVQSCLNEYAIVPKKPVNLLKYTLKVNGKTLWDEDGDGVIIATPTGSTGYAESSGGVTIVPGSRVIEIVPINPLNKRSRPLITDNEDEVEIADVGCRAGAMLVIDGFQRVDLEREDVKIVKSKYPAKLIQRIEVHENLAQKYVKPLTSHEFTKLPPSAKFTYKILESKGSMTVKELEKETFLASRTLRKAIKDLVKAGIIGKKSFWNDPRKSVYFIKHK